MSASPLSALVSAESALISQANAAADRLATVATGGAALALARLQAEAVAARERLLAFAQSLQATLGDLADFAEGLAVEVLATVQVEEPASLETKCGPTGTTLQPKGGLPETTLQPKYGIIDPTLRQDEPAPEPAGTDDTRKLYDSETIDLSHPVPLPVPAPAPVAEGEELATAACSPVAPRAKRTRRNRKNRK